MRYRFARKLFFRHRYSYIICMSGCIFHTNCILYSYSFKPSLKIYRKADYNFAKAIDRLRLHKFESSSIYIFTCTTFSSLLLLHVSPFILLFSVKLVSVKFLRLYQIKSILISTV